VTAGQAREREGPEAVAARAHDEPVVVEEPPEPIGTAGPVDVAALPDILPPGAEPELRGRRGPRRLARAALRWALYAAATGLVAGLGAAVFIAGLDLLIRGVDNVRAALPWWLIFLFPPIGGFAVGYLMWRTDRAAFVSACGTDSFIDAVEEADGRISPRVPALRILGAWLTIGFGGSSGRECPMIYTGSGLGSTVGGAIEWARDRLPRRLAALLDLSPADTRMLALCGAAGALGAVFSAPFGGAIFAVEVPYRRDVNMAFFWPALVSSFTGFAVGWATVGRQRLLHAPLLTHLSWQEWALAIVIAVLASLVGRAFAGIFNGFFARVRDLFHEGRRVPIWVQTGIGGVLAGAVMVAFPQVYGIGYAAIRDTVNGHLFTHHTAAAAVLLFAGMGLAKMVSAAFTVGTGGVGGLLFPSMFTGAALGGVVATAAHAWWPATFPHTAAYVLIAMSATYAAAGKVPIASLLLLCEATANFSLALPMAVANVVAYALSGRSTVYDVQRERSEGDRHGGYPVALAVLVAVVLFGQHVAAI
jgi:CIC family chloride channel protein